MSLNAYVWAASLPLDIVGPTAFRVLLKYADRVDQYGRAGWYNTAELAEQLGCHPRTVQRATRELLDRGLMVEGDQRFVKHIRGDRRPTVYNLNLSTVVAPRLEVEEDEETGDDTTPSVTPHGTTDMSRHGNPVPHATTSAVAHRTVNKPSITSTSVTTEGAENVAPHRRYTVPAAPRFPRFEPEPMKPQPEPRTPEEEAAVELLADVACPNGFGTGKNSRHWFPGTLTGCARCGSDAVDLASRHLLMEGAHA